MAGKRNKNWSVETMAANRYPTVYTPSGKRGAGLCVHCELPKRTHEGVHMFCSIIVVYDGVQPDKETGV